MRILPSVRRVAKAIRLKSTGTMKMPYKLLNPIDPESPKPPKPLNPKCTHLGWLHHSHAS